MDRNELLHRVRQDLRSYINGESKPKQAPDATDVKEEMAFSADFDFLSELDNLANVGEQALTNTLKEDEIDVEKLSNEADKHYDNGEYEKAVELWKKCAEKGYVYAQYSLGLCYKYGDGVNEDHEKRHNTFGKLLNKVMKKHKKY